jgi:hypothetical protein
LCAIWNIKPRLFDHDFVANPRNSGAIAVVCASSWPKIHRFYLFHQAHNTPPESPARGGNTLVGRCFDLRPSRPLFQTG